MVTGKMDAAAVDYEHDSPVYSTASYRCMTDLTLLGEHMMSQDYLQQSQDCTHFYDTAP